MPSPASTLVINKTLSTNSRIPDDLSIELKHENPQEDLHVLRNLLLAEFKQKLVAAGNRQHIYYLAPALIFLFTLCWIYPLASREENLQRLRNLSINETSTESCYAYFEVYQNNLCRSSDIRPLFAACAQDCNQLDLLLKIFVSALLFDNFAIVFLSMLVYVQYVHNKQLLNKQQSATLHGYSPGVHTEAAKYPWLSLDDSFSAALAKIDASLSQNTAKHSEQKAKRRTFLHRLLGSSIKELSKPLLESSAPTTSYNALS